MTKAAAVPTVSAVIPAYNAERYVAAAIESALGQSDQVVDVIVVDDGSQDGTAEVVRRFLPDVRYLYQANAGVAAARNAGIRAAAAPVVAMLDADDVWLPDKTARQLEQIAGAPDVIAVGCGYHVTDERLRVIDARPATPATYDDLLLWRGTGGLTSGSALLVRAEAVRAVGGYDESLSTSADWDLALRLMAFGPVAVVREPLFLYRQHDTNMHRGIQAMERDMIRLLAKTRHASPDRRARHRIAMSHMFGILAGSYWHAGQGFHALRCGVNAMRYDPTSVRYLLQRFRRRRPRGAVTSG